jgi:hypothetical protein
MPIDKAINQAPQLDIILSEAEETPDIEIVLEEDGSAVINMTEDDADEIDFYANLAEVIDEDDLSDIAMDVGAMFEADKSSRSDWEQIAADLLARSFGAVDVAPVELIVTPAPCAKVT